MTMLPGLHWKTNRPLACSVCLKTTPWLQEGLVILSARYGALEAIRKAEQQGLGELNGGGDEGSPSDLPEQSHSRQDRFTQNVAGQILLLDHRVLRL